MGKLWNLTKSVGGLTASTTKLVVVAGKAGIDKVKPPVADTTNGMIDKAIPALEGATARIDALASKISS